MAVWLAQAEPADLPEPQAPMERAVMAALVVLPEQLETAARVEQAMR